MTEEKENEGIVIDVVPEKEPEEVPPQAEPEDQPEPVKTEPSQSKPRSTLPSLILAVLALIGVTATVIVGLQLWSDIQQDIKVLDARFDTAQKAQENLQSAIETANAAIAAQQQLMDDQSSAVTAQQADISAQIQSISNERQHMIDREAELRALVADIHRRIGRSDTQWRVAEAEYLIRVAINRVQLAYDVSTAITALRLADERLRDTTEPQWDPVRQQLAKDIATLTGTVLPDLSGMSARLNALAEQVPSLELAHQQQAKPEPEAGGVTPREDRSWSTLADDMMAGLKDAVRIRRTDVPVPAMLTPDQQQFLYQNLALQLETARLALVQRDAESYQTTLRTARAWVEELFSLEHPATQQMLDEINDLAAIEIQPELPDITQALQILNERRVVNATLAEPLE
ncbi:MAG: uroporphyrinogen-III C-methyltransferase [bacterium]